MDYMSSYVYPLSRSAADAVEPVDGAQAALTGAAANPAYYIAALLYPNSPHWGNDATFLKSSTVGQGATITYGFLTNASTLSGADATGFAAMSSAQKTATRQALAKWAAVANIAFVEETDPTEATIRFATNNQNGNSSGYAVRPGVSSNSGLVAIANDLSSNTSPTQGSYGFLTLVHEIGHALGLKHPGNYNSVGSGTTEGPYLPSAEDNYAYSIMSYYENDLLPYSNYQTQPAIYDVSAIQYLYGANSNAAAGNTTYTADINNFQTIWDPNGSNTLYAGGQTDTVNLNLNGGQFSTVGDTMVFGVAFGTTIEKAVGGAGNDIITGNSANNVLTGGTGNDTIDGGYGNDIAVFSDNYNNYSVSSAVNGVTTIKYLSGRGDGTDTLTGIEALRFKDRDIQLVNVSVTTTTTTSLTSTFSAYAYAALNSDLFAVFGTNTAALELHYITYGKKEGRSAGGFDPYAYAAANSDLFSAFGVNVESLIKHYISNGRSEGRVASGFDPYAYAAQNSDLFSAFGANVSALIQHYISSGKSEGRVASGFDPYAYAAQNSDLFNAFGVNVSSLIRHYVSNGKSEGRSATGFSVEGYAAANGDVFNAVGYNVSSLIGHFVTNGKNEGRDPGVGLAS